MSNNKLPKEIYLLGQDLEYMVEDGQKDLYHIDASLMDVLGRQIKYLSEQHHNEIVQQYEKKIHELLDKLVLKQDEVIKLLKDKA